MKAIQFISVLLLAALLSAPTAGFSQPTPDMPEGIVVSPPILTGQMEAAQLTRSPNFIIWGRYTDSIPESITHFRFMLKRAYLPDGNYCDTRNDFNNHQSYLMPWDDAQWTEWLEWPDSGDEAEVSFVDLPRQEPDPDNPGDFRTIFYLFTTQIMTSDGVVSMDRRYGYQAVNFRVSDNLSPRLTVFHDRFGPLVGSGQHMQRSLEFLGNLDGEFTWYADGSSYGETIASYRWGWDIADVEDPNDPGWALPPGLTDEHKRTGPIPEFGSGIHTLTVQTQDSLGGLTRLVAILEYIPVPDPADQLPLLLVDDVKDRYSNAWPGEGGEPLDNDTYRDAFWEYALTGAGGVDGFDLSRDVIDSEIQQISPRDIVNYRSTVWTARWANSQGGSAVASQLRPYMPHHEEGVFYYNWLEVYQQEIGNLLYCGERAANNFLPESTYLMPIVFESQEGTDGGMDNVGDVQQWRRVGFGQDLQGQPNYPKLFSFSHLGLAAVDITSPSASYVAPNGYQVRTQRRTACVAMKGMVMDEAFRANYNPDLPDTIWTESTIDWADDAFPEDQDVLSQIYTWGNDEFYDSDTLDRGLPIDPQECDGEACVEPMFRTVSRFDWVKKSRLEVDPDDTWPQGYYGGQDQPEIDQLCGPLALDQARTTAMTNNQVTAYVNHKHQDQKPSQQSDVVMGFDPYRFDNDTMASVVQWVLIDHFGLSGGR